jgi:ABC-type enterochelin transport system permease subunit
MTNPSRLLGVLTGTIALVGAGGEMWLLRRTLLSHHPFILLSYPPAEFFAEFAEWALPAVFACCAAASVLMASRVPRLVAIAIPTLAPLLVAVALLYSTRPFADPVPVGITNFDRYGARQAINEYLVECAGLAIAGFACGAAGTFVCVVLARRLGTARV